MKQVRVNIRSVANASKAKKVKRNGRDLMVVPSATLPDGVVMNSIMYPAEEIEKSYKTLERTPAPFGHPMVNGSFLSARDPEGINIGYIGAWNENVRRENGRVYMDKVIDIEVANRCDQGRRVLEAIEKGGPIHTSTGLLANLEETDEDDYEYVARDIQFDHDAILLDEVGAATPDQGVGMLVNGKKLEVVNSSLEERIDEQMDWALDSVVRALEQRDRVSMIQRIKAALVEAFSTERENSREQENAAMASEKETGSEVMARLNKVEDTIKGLGEVVANAVKEALAPVTAQVEAITNANKAREEAEKTALVNKVVEAGVLSKEAAETLTNAALSELASKVKPGKAAALNSSFVSNGEKDEFADYDFNSMIDGKEGK